MLKTFKRGIMMVTAISAIAAGIVLTNAEFQTSKFKDVSSHWVSKQQIMQWAEERNMVNGFPDGTFRPNSNVTAGQMLSLVLRSYGEDTTQTDTTKHWSHRAYEIAKDMNYPTLSNPDQPMNRIQVAELIASTQGVDFKGNYAIKYLLTRGLAKGKVEGNPTVEGYKGNDLLTRAESIAFIKLVIENGKPQMEARPSFVNDSVYQTALTTLNLEYQEYLEKLGLKPKEKEYDLITIETPYTVEDLKALEMQYLNSLKFEDGYLKGTVPVLQEGYEWVQAFPMQLKNGMDYHLSYYWEVVMEKKFISGQSFAIPIQKEWGNLSSGRLSESQIQNGAFSVRIQRKQGVNLSVPRVATSMEYPSKKVTVDVNQ